MKIKILVDSASDIDLEEAKKLNIEMISMEIGFGEDIFLDGVNLSYRQFYEKLIESSEIPKTSLINEFRFDEVFNRLIEEGFEVLCITMSSKLSGTFNAAQKASEKYNGKVQVLDSLNVCVAERLLVLLALRLIEKNLSLQEIVNELNNKKHNIHLLALLNTLKYLQKGGRISAVKAFAGEIMNIKPVIAIVDGEVKLIGKAMGSKKGNNLLNQLIEKTGGIDFELPYATAYSGLNDDLLQKYLIDSKFIWENHTDKVPTYNIGSTIGTHAGPGAIAVAFYGKKI